MDQYTWLTHEGYISKSGKWDWSYGHMEHRHINSKDNEWGATVVHSIWERGSEDDIYALILEVKRNVKAANAVRRAISHSNVYGWPKFFKLYLDKLYGKE